MADKRSVVEFKHKLTKAEVRKECQHLHYSPDDEVRNISIDIHHDGELAEFEFIADGTYKDGFQPKYMKEMLKSTDSTRVGFKIPKGAVSGDLGDTRIRVQELDMAENFVNAELRGTISSKPSFYKVLRVHQIEKGGKTARFGIDIENAERQAVLIIMDLALDKSTADRGELKLTDFSGSIELPPGATNTIQCSLQPLKVVTEEKPYGFTFEITAKFRQGENEQAAYSDVTPSGSVSWKPVKSRLWKAEILPTEAPNVAEGCDPSGFQWLGSKSLHVVYRSVDDRVCELHKSLADDSSSWETHEFLLQGDDTGEARGYTWENYPPSGSQHLVVLRGGAITEWWRRSLKDHWQRGWQSGDEFARYRK